MPLLKILSNSERLRFDTPPIFDSEERKRCFNLPRTLESSLENLRSLENQILFILQFGYFRSRQRFFAGHFHLADLEYVSAKFDIPIENSENLSYSRSSILRQQYIILNYFGVRVISQSDEITLLEDATELVKTVVRPVKIFWQLVENITNLKMVVPTHHWLAHTISKAIQAHERKLVSIIEESLSDEQKLLLDSLLSNDENDPESAPEVNLTSFKQPFHSLKATHIKANLTDWQFLQSIYQNVAPVISKLDLSFEAIRFYAQTVHKTDSFHMARRQDTSRYLHLLAFVAYQSFRLQDMLVDSLLQSVQNATNSATQEYRGQYFQKRLEQRKTLNDLLKSLQTQVFPTFDNISKVLADKESSALQKLERIETSMNENLLERQRIELEIEVVQ